MRDPFADLAKFKQSFVPEPVVTDIWWLPMQHVGRLKQPPDNAFCLMVAAEKDRNEEVARLHYVAGTTKAKGGKTPTLVVEPGDGLPERTYFRFYGTRDLAPATIKLDGKWRQRLPQDRLQEIEDAIRASNLITVKKVLDG